ncbi:MAG: FG-GAP-like repeat-containing protein, partial [Planctomycetota bacterium]
TPAGLANVSQVACGSYHTYALKNDGTVVGWGFNYDGQTNTPAGLANVSQVACGSHTYALKNDGTLVGWGANWNGQTNTPSAATNVTQVACGWDHTYALKNDGTLVGWGYNDYGRTNTPAGLANVSQVACGWGHTYALKNDGTLVGWGYNDYGQTNTPAGLANVTQVACGFGHTYALKNDGTLVGWGWNEYGQTDTPAGLVNVSQVACGDVHTYALKNDGTLVGWGGNNAGQMNSPAGLANVSQVACGGYHTIAILSAELSTCTNPSGAGTATVKLSGSSWQQVGVWEWSSGGSIQTPGALTNVSLGTFGSVGSECTAQCVTFASAAGTSLLVPSSASAAGNDYSIRVGTSANLAGRLWLLGVSGGGSTLPLDLNVPVLSAGTVNGSFDLIQTEVPPPAGKFLTLVPETVSGRTVLSLRLLDIQSSGSLAGSKTDSYSGSAVAAATIDLDQDGFDDLALAVDFGASQPGRIQVLMNDGTGKLGGTTNVLKDTPAQPTCIAAGDIDGDGLPDLVAGFASDSTARVYRRNPANALDLLPGTVLSGFAGTPRSVAVVPPPTGALTAKSSRVKPRSMPAGNNVAVGTSSAKLYFFSNTGVQTQAFLNLSGSVEVMAKGGSVDGVQGTGIATGGIRSTTV